VSSVWDWLEGLGTGISRDDPKTWQHPRWPPTFKGIINQLEVSHQAFVWRIRGNPRLIKVSIPSTYIKVSVPVLMSVSMHPSLHVP
jgi:hypothetical protein